MKKIAFFMHNFTGGGAEKVTIKLANEFHKRGYIVKIIVIEDSGNLEKTVDKEIYIEKLNIKNKSKIIKNFLNILYLKRIFDSKDFNILISVTTHMNLIASIANSLAKNKIKLYATVHSSISMENRSFKLLRNNLIKFFNKYITKTIVVSNEAEQDYIKVIGIGEDETVTIYNPVVSEEIFILQKKENNHEWLQNNRSYKTILAAGRLSKPKNFEMLLKSIAIVYKTFDVRLIILGEGELKGELEKLAEDLGISRIIDFHGFTDNPYSYFYRCDLFTLSSDWEGLPTVLIEALACGCKIVSTECRSGPKEILDNGKYGALAMLNDEEDFASKIIEKLNKGIDKHEQIGRSKDFSVEKSIDKYLSVILNN